MAILYYSRDSLSLDGRQSARMDEAQDNHEPLLIASMSSISYSELLKTVQEINFSSSSSSHANTLHPDLAARVVDFLTIRPVDPDQVQVVGCSSSDGSHPLAACLSLDEDSWWISAADSMPEGKGREYVEFRLSPTLCRVRSVQIKIPPLPAGPLSVRDFVLEAPINKASCRQQDGDQEEEEWTAVSPTFRVQNQSGMQRFFLEPPGIDADRIRIVCLSNQLSDFYNGRVFGFTYQRVGYFTVRFDCQGWQV